MTYAGNVEGDYHFGENVDYALVHDVADQLMQRFESITNLEDTWKLLNVIKNPLNPPEFDDESLKATAEDVSSVITALGVSDPSTRDALVHEISTRAEKKFGELSRFLVHATDDINSRIEDIKKEKDPKKVIAALKSIVEPNGNHTVPQHLQSRIKSLKEMPEDLYGDPQLDKYLAPVTNKLHEHIHETIAKLEKSLTTDDKATIIANVIIVPLPQRSRQISEYSITEVQISSPTVVQRLKMILFRCLPSCYGLPYDSEHI